MADAGSNTKANNSSINSGPKKPLLKDRLFRTSLLSTIVMVALCLSTHLVAIAGMAGAVALFSDMEHGLMFAAIGFAALTVYAVIRHRRRANCGH